MTLYLPQGFRFAGVASGIKAKADCKDVSLLLSDMPAVAAGVYTQNQVVAAPVTLCRAKTPMTDARAVVVNSGNANACTGERGMVDARRMCELAAQCGDGTFTDQHTLVMSTGVIGQPLPMPEVEAGIRLAAERLEDSPQAFLDAADGILTTDVGRKIGSRTCQAGGKSVHLAAMAKGAGMIGPNMATMLACVLTDARLEPHQAQRLLQAAVDKSFNNISVEGHTSTNDTVLLLANGAAGGSVLQPDEEQAFAEQLESLCIELAKLIPADGEGASHLVEVTVLGAAAEADAREISHRVASSNLVKTAVYGNDPNWGRIISAAGYAHATLDLAELQLKINGMLLFEAGEPVEVDAQRVSQSMRDNATTTIELVVGSGPGQCTHWTSDLTVEYVRFNSEYTT